MNDDKSLPRITGRKVIAQGKFLSYHLAEWLDGNGKPRTWEMAERQIGRDAVMVIPRLVPSGRMLLIRQFRPPAGRWVYEFPAGLLEPDETVEEGALREMREETGYAGRVIRIWPHSYTTPGLSSETIHTAEVDVDERAPENANPKPHLDECENIEITPVPISELYNFLENRTRAGDRFDSKVLSFILGLSRSSQ